MRLFSDIRAESWHRGEVIPVNVLAGGKHIGAEQTVRGQECPRHSQLFFFFLVELDAERLEELQILVADLEFRVGAEGGN